MLSDVSGQSVTAALSRLASLPDRSVDCVVSCPVRGDVSARELVSGIRLVWAEVYRVLQPGGTTWLILSDVRAESGSVRGLPWRVVLALQREGWLLRNALIANTGAGESCCQTGFLLVKQPRYFFNIEAVQAGYGKNPGDVVLDGDSLVARCVAAGYSLGGVLLDPFCRLDLPAFVDRRETAA